MNPTSNGSNSDRRRRRVSWSYDEDHHIGQYSDENTLLPINENYDQSDYDDQNFFEHSYDCDGYDDSETDQDSVMDFCEPENEDALGEKQSRLPQHKTSTSCIGGRRRRPPRKVLGKGWEIPSPSVMQRRNRFRKLVDDETRRHRRIVPHSATTSDNEDNLAAKTTESRPQNVLHLLRDRELFGGGSTNGGIRNVTNRGKGSPNTGASGFTIGVPIVVSADSEDASSTKNKRRRRRKKRNRNQTNEDSNNDTTNNSIPNHALPINSKHTTEELRTYVEQACVTKFESSYLSHLQHDAVEETPPESAPNGTNDSSRNNNDASSNGNSQNNDSTSNANQPISNQQNTSSKAVSTISIAFAPDGKTMASTHGDHTVKITCCMTGKLLQTLVGHPRTPWTVKYHPHAGADLKNPKTRKIIIANRTTNTNSIRNNTNNSSQEDSNQQEQQHEYEKQQQQQIVASGCLGQQVRIWDWISGTCLQMIRLEFAIISLSFHPAGNVLAVANGTRLHFWALPTVEQPEEKDHENTTAAILDAKKNVNSRAVEINGSSMNGGSSTANSLNSSSNQPRRGQGMHIEMRHMLRCVHFLPDGKRVIVGGVNPQTQREIQRQRRLAEQGNQEKVPSMSFYLRLWDFDLEAARGPPRIAPNSQSNSNSIIRNTTSNGTTSQHQAMIESTQAAAAAAAAATRTTRRRRAISNPRCFVPRALLYNDGGFDVSPDGKTLCACAEYWLPEGVDNATDLLHPPKADDYYNGFDDDYSSSDDSSSDDETESCGGDKDMDDVTMDEASGEEAKKLIYPEESMEDKTAAVTTDSSSLASVNAKEESISTEKNVEESNLEGKNTSPTRSLASSASHPPSATPPRISGRQPQQISSPPLTLGASASSSSSAGYGLPMPPMNAGITPQTPPPNVNPLNFPLSPPSPPGRRFAGGLTRGTHPASQQHEHLLRQYNHQQLLNQHRLNQQQIIPPPQSQQAGTVPSTPPSRATENASAMIPAPPRINHRNNRQHRLHNHKAAMQNAGNPFGSTSRNARISEHPNTKRGRFVPHVVTISLDTEPYVETTTEEVVIGQDVPNSSSGDAAMAAGQIRSTTVAATSSIDGISNTTIVRKTTYNIPGRGAASNATRPHVLQRRPRLGQLLSACPLDGTKASAVTCVKFSPCTEFCLIGYGVREPHVEETNDDSHPPYHPVTAMYKVNKGGIMRHVSTMLSGDDDVNISRFHPESGYGFVYGTKQGRIRILGPRPWNYYNC